jgi:hypothetical protein
MGEGDAGDDKDENEDKTPKGICLIQDDSC